MALKSTVSGRELGQELLRWRKRAGLSGAALAEKTSWSHTKISRMETGHAPFSSVDIVGYLVACGSGFPQAMATVRRSQQRRISGAPGKCHQDELP